ncbi:cytochrome b5-like heme/steroid binding domain-containing protein [Lentinula guzmanii]|uniref:Cytochrome b5-like heme/steroid binding domain-containing protein n=1 Tax=Lentinula guzmanii TaxID=2804957 RepID=A0AA38JSW9_9AGAR|nr:cytochrome b5-like heme/steroid binding domain-containing protein [Lentinula guzmanii]
MSWLKTSITGEEPQPYVEPESTPRVKDPVVPDRMVIDKAANRPFLAYKAYRDKQQKAHNEWLERQKIRQEKIARGEEVGPEEKDPTEPKEVGIGGLLKFLLYFIVFGALAGKLLTGSYTWNYENRLTQLKSYIPTDQRLFSESTLAKFDGSVPGKPIYLAIDGDVFDVTNGKAYQPGGSYHHFAGVDAARAYGTGCFKTHRTHDLRGLTEAELRGVNHWKEFYTNHAEYKKVGRVSHRPINPASPLPEPCKPPKEKKNNEKASEEKQDNESKVKGRTVHEEL